jgi:succinate dehydrogenase / fumarate reductase, iron-sulfur subunit
MAAPPAATVHVPLSVYRFNPAEDRQPRYQNYELDMPPHTPLLTALLRVRAEIDPTLTLRYSCRSAICGSCAMVVNSKSRLACQTPVGPEVERHGRVVVDPMRNQAVLRDLVVDQTPFWDRYRRVQPFLLPDEEHPMPEGKETPMTPEELARFEETPRCIACAACYSACPAVEVDPAFPGPMALAKLYRFVVDPRDGGRLERLVRIQTDGLWLCLRCHLCTEACPKDVRPSERIRDLKQMAIGVQGATERGSRHALAFKKNIRERGILNEMKLTRETVGPIGLISIASQGVRMVPKKPELLKSPKPIKDLGQVQKLYALLDKEKEESS